MRIAVLGPLEVLTDDFAPVPVPGAKERLLLAVLTAGAPGVVGTERIVESLWDGHPPASAHRSLQAHVVRLRSSLEPGRPKGSTGRHVMRRGPGYALTLDRSSIDALHVGDVAARGHALLASGDAAGALREWDAAVGMWRGEPYADWPDAPFAAAERGRLREVRAGAVAGLLEARLQLGRHAEVLPELERLVAEEPLREDWWRLLMLALYRGGRQADALAAARRARALLTEEIGADPGPALRDMETAVLAQDRRLELPSGRAPPLPLDGRAPGQPASCPYKGLATYQVADAALFHGRRRLVTGLVARLVDRPLLAVSGSSGAGKSSAVRAGLVPALAEGALPGSSTWLPVIVTPGPHPLERLDGLTGDPAPAAPVVLVCDQFEELWSPGVDPVERSAFLDTLLALLDAGIVVHCIVVVRGDHVGRLAEHTAFTERLDAAVVLVPALTDPELREVVREPARTVGLAADPELLDAVVADVLGEDGALPLLSTALVGTWERRLGDRLTLAGYLGAGGVAGAMTRSAETAYAALDDAGREQAHHLMVRFADCGDGGLVVRRPVPLRELDLDSDVASARRRVVEAFVSRRLLAVHGDQVEVAHEALLTGWPRLVRWLEDDAVGRAVRRHLAPAAREWEDGGRPDDELYRGARLAAALDWAAGPGAETTPIERRFLEASRSRADEELTQARQRGDREAAARHRTRRLAVGLAVVLVVALTATVLAVVARRDAQQTSLDADANRLAALSASADTLDLSLLLAAQAVRLADTPDTQDGLLTSLAEHRRVERVVPFDGDPWAAHLAGGGRVLFFYAGNDLYSWKVGSVTPPVALDAPRGWGGGWRVTAPSPSEDVLMAAGQDSRGSPWLRTIAADGSTRLVVDGPAIGGLPVSGAFTADGRRVHLVVAAPPGVPDGAVADTTTAWSVTDVDVADGTARRTGIGGVFPGPLEDMAVSFADDGGSAVLEDTAHSTPPLLIGLADGRTAVVSTESAPVSSPVLAALPSGAAEMWEDGRVTLLDATGTLVQQLDAHQQQVRDIAIAPDGTWAVTVGDGPAVIVWHVDPASGRWSQREELTGHGGDVVAVAVTADGHRVVTMSRDETIITWDMTADGGFGRSVPGLDGRWISNQPQVVEPGRLLVAPTRPGTSAGARVGAAGPETVSVEATFLDPRTGRVVDSVPVGNTVLATFGSSVAVSPDRSLVAVTWGRGVTVLDARTRAVVATVPLPPATLVWCAGWTPDGERLLLGAEGPVLDGVGGALLVIDTATWQPQRPVDIGGPAQGMASSPDGRLIAVTSTVFPEIRLLDARTLDVERVVTLTVDDQVGTPAFSTDGTLLAAGGDAGLLHVFDTSTWQPVGEPVTMHDESMLQVEWLAHSRTVVTTGRDGTVSLFDVDRGVVLARRLPGSDVAGGGFAHLVPAPSSEVVVLSGERTGWRYPMDPSVWLREACAIVGRDLTASEWDRYLPGRDPRPTCSDLS